MVGPSIDETKLSSVLSYAVDNQQLFRMMSNKTIRTWFLIHKLFLWRVKFKVDPAPTS